MSGNVNILEKVLKDQLSNHEAVLVDLLCDATGHHALILANASKWKSGLHKAAGGGACMTLPPSFLNGGGWNRLASMADAAGYVLNVEPAGRGLVIGIKLKSARP